MNISDDRWTCPSCNKTERIPARSDLAPAVRKRVQLEHAERHTADRRNAVYASLASKTKFRKAS